MVIWCVWYFKDTNSKANHNAMQEVERNKEVCLIFQRYKFKSKSQQKKADYKKHGGVFDISKIQIQKQITTALNCCQWLYLVCLIFQRYKFKSKSQHYRSSCMRGDGCVWYFKDTNSKANHNYNSIFGNAPAGVFDISKIQIQKQITTIHFAVKIL